MSSEKSVILIGCGRVARKHLRAIRYYSRERKNVPFRLRPAAVIDPLEDAARETLEKYRLEAPVFADFDSFLASGIKADICAITTPSGSHYPLALRALEEDMHLLLEKPMAMRLPEAVEIARRADAKGLRVALGHIYRYFPVIANLREDIAAGRFGKPLFGQVTVRWGHDQAYYDSAAWRGTRAQDGGAVMNQSIHALDLMHWLLGEPSFATVEAAVTRQVHAIESEDLGYAIFGFDNNVWMNFEGTTNTDPDRQEAEFFVRCERGDARASLKSGKIGLEIHRDGEKKNLKWRYIRRELKQILTERGPSYLGQLGNPHSNIYRDLIRAIATDTPPLADAAAGCRSLYMVESIYHAAGVAEYSEAPDKALLATRA